MVLVSLTAGVAKSALYLLSKKRALPFSKNQIQITILVTCGDQFR